MGFLDTLIKFSDAHARSVIVILIGIIVVGAIGGGLWIQSLKASLNEHEEIKDSRIELIEERYRLGYASMAIKFMFRKNKVLINFS